MIDKIRVLKRAIDEVEQIWLRGKDHEVTYHLVFGHYDQTISPLLDDLGLDFRWNDPNGSFEEDTNAYILALLEFRDKKLPRVWEN